MCDPVTIVATTLAVATTAASVVSQIKSAKAQEAAVRSQLVDQQQEIDSKSAAEMNDALRAARREQARVKVAAGEAGLQLSGSIQGLLTDTLMQTSLSNERTLDNRGRAHRAAVSEANSMLSRIEKPTALGAGLQIASAAVSGYSQGRSIQATRPATASSG